MTREQRILSLASIVHGAAKRYHGDRDDNTQAAWIGAIRAVDTWDGRAPLNGYAWVCCNWEIGKHLRKTIHSRSKRQLELASLEEIIPNDEADNAKYILTLDHGIETAPARIDLHRLLGRLEPRDRAIVTLLSEYSQHELARAIGCGQASIGRVVQRARLAA